MCRRIQPLRYVGTPTVSHASKKSEALRRCGAKRTPQECNVGPSASKMQRDGRSEADNALVTSNRRVAERRGETVVLR